MTLARRLGLLAWSLALVAAAPAQDYQLLRTLRLGGAGRWDFITVDGAAKRLYIPRSTHTMVVDSETGATLADIPGTNGVHGVALAPAQKLGFISCGKDNTVMVFDLTDFHVVKSLKTGLGPDHLIYDAGSGHVLSMNHKGGDITVIDPADLDAPTVTIQVGGALEVCACDGAGKAFVAVEDQSQVVALDTKANKVLARWPLAPGAEPTGVALDVARHRLFVGCANEKVVVVDTQTGLVIGTAPVGKGVDGAAYDAKAGLAAIPNGKDGTLSVVKETTPGRWELVQTLKTVVSARTIDLDPATGRFYLPCNLPDGQGGTTFGVAVVGRP